MKANLLTAFLTISLTALAQPRQETILTDDWHFSRDKQTWQTVRVPHDWAIAGPFDKKWDLQNVAIEQNGETEATEKSGRSGALPWIGEGHYKRTITIPEGYKHAMLVFDGAMAEPTVSINGMQAGYWAYGYNTFRVDITPFIQTGDNLLEVDLQNVEESSRWYPGAGIYRPVKLVLTSKGWIDPWKTFIRTRELNANQAVLDVNVGIGSALDGGLKFEVEICDATGKMVASGSSDDLNNEGIAQMAITVNQPQLWSPPAPTVESRITLFIYRPYQILAERRIARPAKSKVRYPHCQSIKGWRIPAERRYTEDKRRLPASRPRSVGSCHQ